MWDTVEQLETHLCHDLPCLRCGHPAHLFLACSETCGCEPVPMPGASSRAA